MKSMTDLPMKANTPVPYKETDALFSLMDFQKLCHDGLAHRLYLRTKQYLSHDDEDSLVHDALRAYNWSKSCHRSS